MFLHSFAFCCLGNIFFIAGAAEHMEILEERNILKEFMRYPLKNPKKNLDLQVLSLHLRPSSRNKSRRNGLDRAETVLNSGDTIKLNQRRKDTVKTKAKPNTNDKVPQTPRIKRRQELQYEKGGKKYFKKKGQTNNHNKTQRPNKPRNTKLMLEWEEEGEGYKEVKRKNLRARQIEHFTKPRKKKQLKGKGETVHWKRKPANKEIQSSEFLPGNWEFGDLTPMIDGKVLDVEAVLTYNLPEEENYYNTQHMDVLQKRDEKETLKQVIWDGSREHVPLDHTRHRKLIFFAESGGKVTSKELSLIEGHLDETEPSLVTIANEQFNYFPKNDAEQSSVIDFPPRYRVRDSELSPVNPQLWRTMEPIENIPVIDIYSDTIQPEETHTEPYRVDIQIHPWSHGDIVLETEGSGSYNSVSLDSENKIVSVTPNRGSTQTTQETQDSLLTHPVSTVQHSSYNTSPYPADSKYLEVPKVQGSKELLDGKFSPLEAEINHNPEPIYCKPGYKEYGGVCKSQCDIGGIYCGTNGQCVIVENIGAMCRCQQMKSLCYGGECCQSSLTTFQLACVIGACCILLSVFLGSLPFMIRRMDIKAISKSVRTRLWISTLMPQSKISVSSQSADSTVCSDYESLPDDSSFYRTKEMARIFNMWQCERTRL